VNKNRMPKRNKSRKIGILIILAGLLVLSIVSAGCLSFT